MKRFLCWVAVVLVVCTVRIGVAQGLFSYAVPPDFLSLSSGAPAENFARVSPALVERSRLFTQYAVVLKEDEIAAEVTARTGPGNGSPSHSVDVVVASAAKGAGFRELHRELFVLQGVDCASVEFAATAHGVAMQKLVYILPLGTQRAWVTLEARAADFEQYRASFEASIASARGLHEASDSDPGSNTATLGALLMAGGIGVVIAKAFSASKKRRRKARPQRAPESDEGE